jgi:multidrug efflux system membrane fusion protein
MKLRATLLGFVPLALFLLIAVGCNRGEVHAAAPLVAAPLVTVVHAEARDVPLYLDEIGKTSAFESVTVSPQVSGRIVERTFQDGAELKKGQLLFAIDPRPFQAQVDSARATLDQQKAALELAVIQFARDQEIIGTKAISKQDYDVKKNAVDVGKAQVEAAQAVLETAKLNLEYCYIHSPIDGRAGKRLVDAGNIVQANSTPLLSIQHLDPIYADFTITERDLPQVQREMARGTLQTLVRIPSEEQASARPGKVTFLDNAVQNGTGTVNLRATVPNHDDHFWPGQFVGVRLILATEHKAVLVPNQAVQISQKGPFVFVVKPDGTAELRLVSLGQRQGESVVIEQGVGAGETVVLTGQMTVNPGGKVRVAGDLGHGRQPEASTQPNSGREDGEVAAGGAS